MPFGQRSRIMNVPGAFFARWSIPTHLRRVLMSASSTSFQSRVPARMAAAYS